MTIGSFAVLAGCLFPSFDDLKNNASGSSGATDDDDDTTGKAKNPKDSGTSGTSGTSASGGTSGTSSGGTSSGGTSSGTSGVPDAASDTSSPPAKAIRCHNLTCGAGQICCAPIVGDYECQNAASPNCDANDILVCDGAKDCAPGQFCCQGGPSGGASVCSNTPCSGFTYCQADDPCPNGKSCNGGAPGGPDDFKSCQ